MKNILVIPKSQFGYHTDYFMMIEYLAFRGIKVDVICYDFEEKKVNHNENVLIKYIKRSKVKLFNILFYYLEIVRLIIKNKYDCIIISSSLEFGEFLPLLFRKYTNKSKWLLDIRTGSVNKNQKTREKYNKKLEKKVAFFDHTTIISELLATKLNIKNYYLLPLGARRLVQVQDKKINKKKINYLYIGTFENRNLEIFIKAFDQYCTIVKNNIEVKLDIVGFAETYETELVILSSIQTAKNNENIIFHGRKNHDELIDLLQEATVGISYIPITDFFNVQPPTKTYEYLINGIVCFATKTEANKGIINYKNGVLVHDQYDEILKGLLKLNEKIENFDPKEISETVFENTWENIEANFFRFLIEITEK